MSVDALYRRYSPTQGRPSTSVFGLFFPEWSSMMRQPKTNMNENQRRRWLQRHPDYNNRDSHYQLFREDQVIMVQLEDWTFKTQAS